MDDQTQPVNPVDDQEVVTTPIEEEVTPESEEAMPATEETAPEASSDEAAN